MPVGALHVRPGGELIQLHLFHQKRPRHGGARTLSLSHTHTTHCHKHSDTHSPTADGLASVLTRPFRTQQDGRRHRGGGGILSVFGRGKEPPVDPRGRVAGGLCRRWSVSRLPPLLLVLVWKRRRKASSAPDSSPPDLLRGSVQQSSGGGRLPLPPKKRQRRTVRRKTREA